MVAHRQQRREVLVQLVVRQVALVQREHRLVNHVGALDNVRQVRERATTTADNLHGVDTGGRGRDAGRVG